MAITKVTNSLVATNAIQGTLIADNAITSVHIAQNQVTSVQIPDGSITAAQLGANSVDSSELVDGSIDTSHIANGQVTESKLAANSVRTTAIAQNQITSKHIADGSITDTQLGSGAFTMGNITTTGSIRGPASLTIDPATVGDNTGTVVIAGNLQVDGTTTTVNSTTLDVVDKNITLGKGGSASANNGGGITIDGAAATLLYTHSTTSWDMNRPLNVVSGTVGATVATFEGNYSGSGTVKLASFERSGSAVAAAVTYTDATTDMEFGTTTGHSLSLTTGNTRKLTITNAGDVSIADGDLYLGAGSGQTFIEIAAGTTNAKTWRIYNGISWNADALLIYNHTNDNTALTIEPNSLGVNRGASSLSHNLEVGGTSFLNGNVGIGTSSPNKPLTVTSDSGANCIALRARSADDYSFIQFFNNAGSALRGQIYSHSSGDIGFTTGTDSSAGNDLYIKNGTGIGIGGSPSAGKLDIVGGISGVSVRVRGDVGGGAYYYGYMFDGTNVRGTTQTNIFYSGSAIAANTTVTDYAGIRIDQPSTAASGAVVTNNYAIYSAGAAQKSYFAGKVGIGTTTPESNHAKANNLVVGGGGAGGMAVFNGTAEGWYAFSRSNANNSDAYDGGMSYNGDRDLKFHTNAGTERMRITGTGDAKFAANATGGALIKGVSGDQTDRNTGGYPQFTFVGNEGTGMRRVSSNVLAFDNSGAESMRINSSGDVMIATLQNEANTDANDGGGTAAFFGMTVNRSSNYAVNISSRRASPLILNRMANDGSVITINQAGSTDGQINTLSGRIAIGSGDTGIFFDSTRNCLSPFTMTGNDGRTAAIDIGRSGVTFKDLYLSNALNIGGAITSTVASGGGIYHSITHSGNEAWSWEAQSGSGSDDYLDVGISGGTRCMSWHEDGKIGIGTATPQERLEVRGGTTTGIRASGGSNTNNKVEIGYDNSTGPYIKSGSSGITKLQVRVDNTSLAAEFRANGDFYSNDGTVHSLSDSRVKKDIADLTDGLNIVKQLKPRTFKYTKDSEFYNKSKKNKVSYGFIANEVEEVAPQYTNTGKGKIGNQEVDDLKSLSTTKMIPMLVKAIQEQQTQIDELKAEVQELKNNG